MLLPFELYNNNKYKYVKLKEEKKASTKYRNSLNYVANFDSKMNFIPFQTTTNVHKKNMNINRKSEFERKLASKWNRGEHKIQ